LRPLSHIRVILPHSSIPEAMSHIPGSLWTNSAMLDYTAQTLQSPENLHHIQFHSDLIANDAVPLLLDLEAKGLQVDNGELLISWA
jgi:hypothetical protein